MRKFRGKCGQNVNVWGAYILGNSRNVVVVIREKKREERWGEIEDRMVWREKEGEMEARKKC